MDALQRVFQKFVEPSLEDTTTGVRKVYIRVRCGQLESLLDETLDWGDEGCRWVLLSQHGTMMTVPMTESELFSWHRPEIVNEQDGYQVVRMDHVVVDSCGALVKAMRLLEYAKELRI